MIKKLILTILAFSMLSVAVAQYSPTYAATGGTFSAEADDSLSVINWSETDVDDSLFFAGASYTTFLLPYMGGAWSSDSLFVSGEVSGRIPNLQTSKIYAPGTGDLTEVRKFNVFNLTASVLLGSKAVYSLPSVKLGVDIWNNKKTTTDYTVNPEKTVTQRYSTSYGWYTAYFLETGMKLPAGIGIIKPFFRFEYKDNIDTMSDSSTTSTASNYDHGYVNIYAGGGALYLFDGSNGLHHTVGATLSLLTKDYHDYAYYSDHYSSYMLNDDAEGDTITFAPVYKLEYTPSSAFSFAAQTDLSLVSFKSTFESNSSKEEYVRKQQVLTETLGATYKVTDRFTLNGSVAVRLLDRTAKKYYIDSELYRENIEKLSVISTNTIGAAFNLTDSLKADVSCYWKPSETNSNKTGFGFVVTYKF